MENFVKALSEFVNIPEDHIHLLDKLVEKISVKKKTQLLTAGSVSDYIYFIDKGLIRFYINDSEKNDISVKFFTEGSFFSNITSFTDRTPSKFNIETIENSVLHRIHRDNLAIVYEKFPEIQKVGRLMYEQALKEAIENNITILTSSAEERYRQILNDNQKLVLRIPVKYLSTYLGIHPNSLSRIRKKIR